MSDTGEPKRLDKSGVSIYPDGGHRKRSERGTRADEQKQDHYLMTRDFESQEVSGGQLRVEEMHVIQGLDVNTGWHYHVLDLHIMCTLKGNLTVEFEDGVFEIGPGMRMRIPGGTPHRGLGQSPDWEGMEITIPAKFKTVPCPAPNAKA